MLVAILVAWALGTAVPISMLMASHDLPLPRASLKSNRIAAASPTTWPATARAWRVIHVLADGCPCSAAVGRSLQKRGTIADAEEIVAIQPVDAGQKSSDLGHDLAAAGFPVAAAVPADVASKLDIEGGPWLVIVDPAGNIAYSGGYAAQRPRVGLALQDVSILQRLRQHDTVKAFPAYGCATSRRLQQAIDPVGLKY